MISLENVQIALLCRARRKRFERTSKDIVPQT